MSLKQLVRAALIAGALAAGPATRAAEPVGTLAKPADVLVWSQPDRQARFSRMETILPHRTVRAGHRVHPLPAGPPLAPLWPGQGGARTVDGFMAENQTVGLLVLQKGRIRLERYRPTLSAAGHWASFSVAKSVTATLFGAALKDGYIKSLDDPVTAYLPEMKGSAYEGVTIRHLLTMTSSVRWSEDYGDPRSDVARMYSTPADPGLDPIVSFMRRLPREAEPGTRWSYKTGETDLAGILLSRATGKSLSDYLSQKIWRPYGMQQDAVWMINETGDEPGGCCLSAAMRDFGRFGQFMLDGGVAGGRHVLPDGWIAQATTTRVETGFPGLSYGFFWWTNPDGTYEANGIFGQSIHIDPKRGLVVVMLSAWPAPFDQAHAQARAGLFAAVAAAIDAEALQPARASRRRNL